MGSLLSLHRLHPQRYPFLLDSTGFHPQQGRYDILFAFPGETLADLGDGGLHGAQGLVEGGFLPALDQWLARERVPPTDAPVPFTGGWFVFLAYELAVRVEPTLKLALPKRFPLARATRVPAAIVRDRARRETWLVAERRRAALLDTMRADARQAGPAQHYFGPLVEGPIIEEPPQRYLDAVARAKDYIARGDVYQANISRKWAATLARGVRPADIYARLRRTNPAPFSGLATWGEHAILSTSPECLLRCGGGWLETRPIAGTRPRGTSAAEDAALGRELAAHPKEQAEHVMLLDLERNDLGRVCRAGSVRVREHMAIESYAHVHHIVSSVTGELRDDVTVGQAIAAVYPGGTITGCPKVRSIQVISELESGSRGPYTGSMGYINRDGSLDLNILIRTVTRWREVLTFRAGAGIVADSIAQAELEETRAKARGVLLALAGEGDQPSFRRP